MRSLAPWPKTPLSQMSIHIDTNSTPLGSLTCSQVGPMSLGWPLAPQGGLAQSHHTMPPEDANGEHPGDAEFALPHLRWRRDALQPPEVLRDRLNKNTYVHLPDGGLRCISWNTRGLVGSLASSQLSRERKHVYLTRLAKNNDMNFYLSSRYWSHSFSHLAHSYQII